MNARKPKNWETPSTKEIEVALEKVKTPKDYHGRLGRFQYIAESLGISTQTIYDWLHGTTKVRWAYWFTLNKLNK